MSARADLLITSLDRCQSRVFCALLWGSNRNCAFQLCSIEFGSINWIWNHKRSKATLLLERVSNFGVANLRDDSIELSRSFAYSTYHLWRMEKKSKIHADSFPDLENHNFQNERKVEISVSRRNSSKSIRKSLGITRIVFFLHSSVSLASVSLVLFATKTAQLGD